MLLARGVRSDVEDGPRCSQSLAMAEELPPGPGGGVPEWIADLKHLPGAASAIGRLIGGVAKAGAAWVDISVAAGEERTQAIRARKEARSTLTKEAVKAIAKQMNEDPELAERALNAGLGGFLESQENREAIAVKTIEHLKDEPPAEVATAVPPSEDWMSYFEKHAERASSEVLREHWARILAGEIRKPGTFSLVALQFMSVLDPALAATIERVAPFVAGFAIYETKATSEPPLLLDLVTLDALGFLRRGLGRRHTINTDGNFVIVFGPFGILVSAEPGGFFYLNCSILTQMGREVLGIVEAKPTLDSVRSVARQIRAELPGVVKLVRILSIQGETVFFNELEDVPASPPA
jgi:hypothetical protein